MRRYLGDGPLPKRGVSLFQEPPSFFQRHGGHAFLLDLFQPLFRYGLEGAGSLQ